MKGVAGYLITAMVLLALAAGAWSVAGFERAMADAQQHLVTREYEDAAASLTAAERIASRGAWLPTISSGTLREIAARRAALDYWQQRYAEVLPRPTDPVGAVDPANTELQVIVANAAWRVAVARANNRPTTLQAFEEGLSAYATILKGERWNEDAAYGYEFLMRMRDEFARSRSRTVEPRRTRSDNSGESGTPAKGVSGSEKFEIYVPLDGTERTKAGDAGKGNPVQRKG